jgi:hypothetical protein
MYELQANGPKKQSVLFMTKQSAILKKTKPLMHIVLVWPWPENLRPATPLVAALKQHGVTPAFFTHPLFSLTPRSRNAKRNKRHIRLERFHHPIDYEMNHLNKHPHSSP